MFAESNLRALQLHKDKKILANCSVSGDTVTLHNGTATKANK